MKKADDTAYVVTVINTSMFTSIVILSTTYRGKVTEYKHAVGPVSRYAFNLTYVPEEISVAFDYYSGDML